MPNERTPVIESGRFTMMEPCGPTNAPPEQKTWRVTELMQRERFTVLDATGEPPVVTALSAWIAEQRRFGVIPPGEPAEVIAHRTLDRLRHELSRAAG